MLKWFEFFQRGGTDTTWSGNRYGEIGVLHLQRLEFPH